MFFIITTIKHESRSLNYQRYDQKFNLSMVKNKLLYLTTNWETSTIISSYTQNVLLHSYIILVKVNHKKMTSIDRPVNVFNHFLLLQKWLIIQVFKEVYEMKYKFFFKCQLWTKHKADILNRFIWVSDVLNCFFPSIYTSERKAYFFWINCLSVKSCKNSLLNELWIDDEWWLYI